MSTKLTFNGINAATGGYLLPDMSTEQIAKLAQGESLDQVLLTELQHKHRQVTERGMGLKEERHERHLDKSGWGIVFSFEDNAQVDAIKEALQPLLELRREQAGDLYKEYIGPDALRPGESKNEWLARHKVSPGRVDPTLVPYYLLLVGDPERISYRFQYQLSVQFAVGRIHFDTLKDYEIYARSVVEAERGDIILPRRAVFFGVQNKGDMATSQSTSMLIEPLIKQITEEQPDWKIEKVLKQEATKARLSALLGGDETPALLFTTSHGIGFPKDDPRQLRHQGGLLCQDWPGPLQWQEEIPDTQYFSGDDIGATSRLHGLISFHFACYGAGTPQLDDFSHSGNERKKIASQSFIARLPQRLISHPQGSALAAIGHVERAWTYSFKWGRAGAQTKVFENTFERLMAGYPVGSALKYFPERYAEISTSLTPVLADIKFGANVDNDELAGMWTANNDARSYVIIGDPAVRLATEFTEQADNTEHAAPAPVVRQPFQLGNREPEPESVLTAEVDSEPAEEATGGTSYAIDDSSSEQENTFTVTTYTAADVEQGEGRKIAVQSTISDNEIETVVAEEQVGNGELLGLHRGLVERVLDGRGGGQGEKDESPC